MFTGKENTQTNKNKRNLTASMFDYDNIYEAKLFVYATKKTLEKTYTNTNHNKIILKILSKLMMWTTAQNQ